MTTMMFYEKAVPLDRERHRHLRIKQLPNQRFAAGAAAIPLVVGEFVDAAREYPIVFARNTQGALTSVALTGNRPDHNLYLDGEGHWNARYIPAFVRRYPFIFAERAPDQLILCIDEAYPAFGTEEGDPLFDDKGEPSPVLQDALKLLNEYQRQTIMTQGFITRLREADLLRERQMRTNMPDGRSASLDGFLVVDEAQLRASSDEKLRGLFDSGELALIYAHLFSLGNFVELARRQPLAAKA